MGCGCSKGSGAGATGSSRIAPTKRPGYTWDGPEAEVEDETADEAVDETDDE